MYIYIEAWVTIFNIYIYIYVATSNRAVNITLRVAYLFHRIIVSFQYNPQHNVHSSHFCYEFPFPHNYRTGDLPNVSVFQKHFIYLPCVRIRESCALPNGPIIITDVGSGTFNTLWTGDADLRLYITTAQDG